MPRDSSPNMVMSALYQVESLVVPRSVRVGVMLLCSYDWQIVFV